MERVSKIKDRIQNELVEKLKDTFGGKREGATSGLKYPAKAKYFSPEFASKENLHFKKQSYSILDHYDVKSAVATLPIADSNKTITPAVNCGIQFLKKLENSS